VLTARDLSVRRGRRTVLTGVSLDLALGTVTHLGGANGAGKTSLLRVLGGLARAASGTLVRPGATAFVPERVALVPALPCGEWLAGMRRLRRLAPVDWGEAVRACGLDEAILPRRSATLSKGMLQRIAILEAVRAEGALLLLDEPFAGLDADGRAWLGAEIGAGRTVLFTDHSGAAGIASDARLRIQDGTCVAEPSPPRAPAVRIRAVRGGETLTQRVPAAAGDDLLRALLEAGWHIEGVEPCATSS